MGAKAFDPRDAPLLQQGFVPAGICARWGAYHLSSVHRAVDRGEVQGQRVGRRLYVRWESWRAYLGPLAANLPNTPAGAVETASC